jgi:hypothetical protein
MVVLGERVDGELPVDGAVEHLLAQRRPSPDAPGFQFVGQWPEKRRDVLRGVAVERNPQEAGTFGGRQLGQFGWAGTYFGKSFVTRHSNEVTVQVVGPRVVRTSDAARGPAALDYA